MAGVPVVLPDGTTGTVDRADVPNIGEGGRVLTPEEHASVQRAAAERDAPVTAGSLAKDYGESILAGEHALQRGIGEAVGVPLDEGITGIADIVGGDSARRSTAQYLRDLDSRHRVLTTATGVEGNVAGALGAAVALKAPGAIGSAPMAGVRGFAARAAYGGAENVLQAQTRDINEAALGDHKVNGEKLLAAAPERFLVGGILTGAFEGAAHGLGMGVSALRGRAVPALEEGASRAIGREVGAEDTLAAGERIRGLAGGEVPKTRGEIGSLLEGEQAAQLARAGEEHAGIVDALAGRQTAEAAELGARQEAARKGFHAAGEASIADADRVASDTLLDSMARGGAKVEEAELGAAARAAAARQEVEAVTGHYGILQKTVAEERAAAMEAANALKRERISNASKLQEAIESAERHAGIVSKDAEAQATRAAVAEGEGRLTRAEWDDILDTQLGITGHSTDPNARWAFEEVLRKEYGEPIEAAEVLAKRVENLEVMTGESSASKLSRLRSLSDQLKIAHEDALAHVGTIDKAGAELEKNASKDIAKAEANAVAAKSAAETAPEAVRVKQATKVESAHAAAEADRGAARETVKGERDAFEKGATKEKGKLLKLHESEAKKLPGPSKKTDVDPFIEGMKRTGEARANQPLVSGNAGLGAMFSVLHGNPFAAAASLAGSFAAGRARAAGNLASARALHGLADQISKVDDAVRAGTALILGRTGARGVAAASHELKEDDAPKRASMPSFDKISKDLIAAQANPAILERRVAAALGPIAKEAPQTYGQTLAATQRAHSFLLSVLPQPQRDPYTLTPQLEHGAVDATSQYEFMQSYGTVIDPLSIYKDVNDKSVTEQQVLAIETVYPSLYAQMQAEVEHQKMSLKSPVEYERSIHVGTLLGVITDEVLEPDFQTALTTSYKDKAAQGAAVGSKAQGSESKTAKSMMSGSEAVEGGTP